MGERKRSGDGSPFPVFRPADPGAPRCSDTRPAGTSSRRPPAWPRPCPPSPPRLFAAGPKSKEKLGFALVGLGRLSKDQLAPALQSTKHARLAAVVTGTPEKGREWRAKYGLPASAVYDYDSFDRIASNGDVDVIDVVLPNGMHKEFTVRAAEAGKHVFCEKPMAVSSDECRAMIAACEKAGVKLGVAYRCQFEPHHLECIRLAREGAFGAVRQIDAGFGFRIEDYSKDDPKHWRLEKKLAGGGPLMDVGIYALNACRYLTGAEPVSVTAETVKTNPSKFDQVEETLVWTMTFPKGATAVCSTTYNYNGVNKFTAYADRDSFGLEPAFGYAGIQGFAGKNRIEAPPIDQFAAELDAFALCVKEDRPTIGARRGRSARPARDRGDLRGGPHGAGGRSEARLAARVPCESRCVRRGARRGRGDCVPPLARGRSQSPRPRRAPRRTRLNSSPITSHVPPRSRRDDRDSDLPRDRRADRPRPAFAGAARPRPDGRLPVRAREPRRQRLRPALRPAEGRGTADGQPDGGQHRDRLSARRPDAGR